jgi:hypothetical protein
VRLGYLAPELELLVPAGDGNNPELLTPGITESRLGLVGFGELDEGRAGVGL